MFQIEEQHMLALIVLVAYRLIEVIGLFRIDVLFIGFFRFQLPSR